MLLKIIEYYQIILKSLVLFDNIIPNRPIIHNIPNRIRIYNRQDFNVANRIRTRILILIVTIIHL